MQCAYHGWRFDGRGRCVAVPALPQFVPPAEHRACAYSARLAYGLVWVALRADVQARERPRLPGGRSQRATWSPLQCSSGS